MAEARAPAIVGHPTGKCPFGIDPAGAPNLAKAKSLIQKSGLAGTPVTVYSQQRVPRTQYITYYASVLNSIGLKATIKSVADALYFPTIGTLKLHPQTGFADWNEDFPNPGDFYLLLDKNSIQATGNVNYGEVNDPKIQTGITTLDKVPASELKQHASDWSALDSYTASKAYNIVFGYQTWPVFASTKVDYSKLVVQLTYGWDWTSIKLK